MRVNAERSFLQGRRHLAVTRCHCSAGRKVKYRGRREKEGEMLTFSREQQSVEAAVAVFFHPPSPLSTSHVPSLFSFSCFPARRMTGMKCWLLIKTTRPASVPVILLTCSLSLSFSSSHFLIISLYSVSSVIPLVLCLRPPAVPAPSLTLFSTRLLCSHFHPSILPHPIRVPAASQLSATPPPTYPPTPTLPHLHFHV